MSTQELTADKFKEHKGRKRLSIRKRNNLESLIRAVLADNLTVKHLGDYLDLRKPKLAIHEGD